jgi:hypothetical protein
MAHRILLAAAAALAVFTVGGCDINTGAPKPAQSTCNCNGTPPPRQVTTPPAPSEPYTPPEHYRRRHERYAYGSGGHRYYWRRGYSEIAVQTYDYHSDSSSTVIGEDGDGYDHRRFHHDGGVAYAGDGVHGEGWIDGYGRHHGGDTGIGAPAPVSGPDAIARLQPWHAYDIDCPDDERDPYRRH